MTEFDALIGADDTFDPVLVQWELDQADIIDWLEEE